MKTQTTYTERLYRAMSAAGIKSEELAEAVGVTYHGIRKVLEGKSGSLNALNNARAAKALGIDSDWLATGEGEMMRASNAWPFDFPREDYASLTPEQKAEIQGAIKVMMLNFVSQRKQIGAPTEPTVVKMVVGYTSWPLPVIKKPLNATQYQRSFFEAAKATA